MPRVKEQISDMLFDSDNNNDSSDEETSYEPPQHRFKGYGAAIEEHNDMYCEYYGCCGFREDSYRIEYEDFCKNEEEDMQEQKPVYEEIEDIPGYIILSAKKPVEVFASRCGEWGWALDPARKGPSEGRPLTPPPLASPTPPPTPRTILPLRTPPHPVWDTRSSIQNLSITEIQEEERVLQEERSRPPPPIRNHNQHRSYSSMTHRRLLPAQQRPEEPPRDRHLLSAQQKPEESPRDRRLLPAQQRPEELPPRDCRLLPAQQRPEELPRDRRHHSNRNDDRRYNPDQPRQRLLTNAVPTPPPERSVSTTTPPRKEPRKDLLCFNRKGHDSFCHMCHDLDSWNPKTCRFQQSCKKASQCTFWHKESESKKAYIKRSLVLKDTFFSKHKQEFTTLYLDKN